MNWITLRLITSVGLAGANSHLLVLDARACLARAIVSFCYNSSGPRGASLPMEGREIPRGFSGASPVLARRLGRGSMAKKAEKANNINAEGRTRRCRGISGRRFLAPGVDVIYGVDLLTRSYSSPLV